MYGRFRRSRNLLILLHKLLRTRHALTVASVKSGRGACWNHAINSLSAMLYTRFVIGEETLSSTSAFNFSHWAILSITTKSFIFSPFNGHYRPPGLYFVKQDTSSFGEV